MHVLVVEDSPVFRHALTAVLHSRFPDLEVHEADTIALGRDKAEQTPICLALVDLQLPDGTGLDLIRAIRCRHPQSCIIVCTTHDLPEYREAAFTCGASHFIPKATLDLERLCSLVREAVEPSPAATTN